jgi:hypothetical protein
MEPLIKTATISIFQMFLGHSPIETHEQSITQPARQPRFQYLSIER